MISRDKIRPSSIAGTYYPADKYILERDISLLLENAPEVKLPRPIRAIIVPHAGYFYSGGVAARAYRQIMEQKYDVAVVIAPAHQEQYDFISIYPGRGLHTPLGDLPLEMSIIEKLTFLHPDIRLSEQGYQAGESGLEVQLPFLKWTQDSIHIVPLMLGEQSERLMQILIDILPQLLQDKNCLLIASSDLSRNHSDAEARALDQVVIQNINDFNPNQLIKDIQQRRCEMCGYGAVFATMNVARTLGAQESKVLLYRNSGDITGEKTSVEGYLSAIIY